MLSILVCHSYFLRFDSKQVERAKPYPPLATLQVAGMLRQAGHQVALFDAMLATGIEEYDRKLAEVKPQVVLFYEDTFNFLSKMCLGKMRDAACKMIGTAHRAGARVIACGPDVSDAPEPYLRAGADVALAGEGLATLMDLIPKLDGNAQGATGELIEGLSGTLTLVNDAVVKINGARVLVEPRPDRRKRRLGPAGHRALPLGLDKSTRLLQSQHGRLARLLLPLQLVREADLGQPVPATQRGRGRERDVVPEGRLQTGSHLVCRRHLRLPGRLGARIRRRAECGWRRRSRSPSRLAPT